MATVPSSTVLFAVLPPPPPHATKTAAAAGSNNQRIADFKIHNLSDEKITDRSILLMRFSFGNKIL
jgi:hypothetical protein